MAEERAGTPDSSTISTRAFRWLNRRIGLDSLLHQALDEPIPGGAKLAYVFGSGLLFLFLSQVVTGVFLAMYYVPSADHAHTTVSYITKEVSSGSFVRSIHSYGSSAIIILLLLHLLQTFLYGAYKGRRELLWLAGCVLLALMLGMSFTGYLLPWDQKAYFATTVGTNIFSELPWLGNALKRLLRGGTEMGTLTLSRFYVLHVFVLPGLLFLFIAVHVFLFRKAGAAGPISEDLLEPKQAPEPFYPRQLMYDIGFALLIIVSLAFFAHYAPTELGPKADPAGTQYLPRPEWYYLPMFEWLKHWQGATSVIGILIIPSVLAGLLVGLPFFDRGLERRPWKRPFSVGLFLFVLAGLGFLGIQSRRGDLRSAGVAAQLEKQNEEVRQFMKSPFEPELSSGSLTSIATAASNPLAAKGKDLFAKQQCNSCHGENGIGTAAAPKLLGIATKADAAKLTEILHTPTAKMQLGGMEAVDLKDDEMKALVEYLRSLK